MAEVPLIHRLPGGQVSHASSQHFALAIQFLNVCTYTHITTHITTYISKILSHVDTVRYVQTLFTMYICAQLYTYRHEICVRIYLICNSNEVCECIRILKCGEQKNNNKPPIWELFIPLLKMVKLGMVYGIVLPTLCVPLMIC